MSRNYVAVLVIEAVIIAGLWLFGRAFSWTRGRLMTSAGAATGTLTRTGCLTSDLD